MLKLLTVLSCILFFFSFTANAYSKNPAKSGYSVHKVNSQGELPGLIQSSPRLILEFYSTYCGPCKTMSSVLSAAARANPDIRFAKIDVEEQPGLSQSFGVKALPTTVFLKNGREMGRFEGAKAPQDFQSFLNRHK